MNYHEPVMVQQVLEALQLKPGMAVLDGTFGHGGHAIRMAHEIGEKGTVIALDRDPAMLERGRRRLEEELGSGGPRCIYAAAKYEEAPQVLRDFGVHEGLDAVLLDLGVNSQHLDEAQRGFSFSKDAELDGRFNPAEGTMTMAELVNTAEERELERIMREYADERLARRIARRIVSERATQHFTRTGQLAEVISACYPPAQRHGRIHPATRAFQAFRIAVNDEMGCVERGVRACLGLLNDHARMAVITFHSVEDRIVKRIFREASSPRPDPDNPYSATTMAGVMYIQHERKAIAATEEEAGRNPRARSAKLRVIERKEAGDAHT